MKTSRQRGPFFIPVSHTGYEFPDPDLAMDEPNGLLAIGGDLSPGRLIEAYHRGIFPWYNDGQPILWWSPDPRAVLFPDRLKVSRSLKKVVDGGRYAFTYDQAFDEVIRSCAAPRSGGSGTWITDSMMRAYQRLHDVGVAHSAECWEHGELAGGLYGVALGRVFFGESMFYRRRDASKATFVHLVRQLRAWGYALIDCQVSSEHLASLGAVEMERAGFLTLLSRWSTVPEPPGAWRRNARDIGHSRQP